MSDPIWKRGGWDYDQKIEMKENKKTSCPNVEAEYWVRLRNRTKEDWKELLSCAEAKYR
jgi:hypothetical protein